MLPPVDPAVLKRNPNFEILYNDLLTRKLNPEGSTRDTKKQRVHDEIRKVGCCILLLNYNTSFHFVTLCICFKSASRLSSVCAVNLHIVTLASLEPAPESSILHF